MVLVLINYNHLHTQLHTDRDRSEQASVSKVSLNSIVYDRLSASSKRWLYKILSTHSLLLLQIKRKKK